MGRILTIQYRWWAKDMRSRQVYSSSLLNGLTNYIKAEGLVTGLLDFDSLHSLYFSSELQRAVDICHLSPATRSQKLLQVKPRRFLQGGISAFQNQHVFLVSKSFKYICRNPVLCLSYMCIYKAWSSVQWKWISWSTAFINFSDLKPRPAFYIPVWF